MYLSGVSPSLPQSPSGRQVIFLADFWSRLSRPPRITVKANYTQNKYCHKWENFFLGDCRVKRLLPVIQFKEKEFQNGAGAKCCGGEEGVCEEMCAYEVSAGRNIETAEPVIIISHPLTSLPNVWVSSSFVLLPPPAVTFSFMWQAAQQKHQSLFVNVNCRWPNNLGVSESVDCFELNFNV